MGINSSKFAFHKTGVFLTILFFFQLKDYQSMFLNTRKVVCTSEPGSTQPPLKKNLPSAVSDLATGERFENGVRIKTLPPSVVKDIEQKNIARRLAGISVIQIRVRRCLACSFMFESSGNRTCGCSSRTAGTIAGREII